MIGKTLSFVLCPLSVVRHRLSGHVSAQATRRAQSTKHKAQSTNAGFTLLELMIVMFIIVILASIALPQYQRHVLHARETVLKDDLFKMRAMIDQYAADKGKLPPSLDELVTAGYLREVPVDPITNEKDWTAEIGEDPNSNEGEQGLINVRSSSTDTATDGSSYNQW